jgi:hypothetical protein
VLAALGWTLVLTAALAGCTSLAGERTSAGAAPTGTARKTTPNAGQLADFAVAEAYREFWWVVDHLDQQPPVRWHGILSVVAANPELATQLDQAADRQHRGVHRYGEVVPHVASIRFSASMMATVLDCQDASRSGEADNLSGRPRTVGAAHTPMFATLTRATEYGTWRVTSLTFTADGCE